jgi:hypothetical protein
MTYGRPRRSKSGCTWPDARHETRSGIGARRPERANALIVWSSGTCRQPLSAGRSRIQPGPRHRIQPGPGSLENTPAMMPARTVSAAAATGVTMAAMGRRVGSEPVSTTGSAGLRIVATSQTVSVATARPTQMGRWPRCAAALPGHRPQEPTRGDQAPQHVVKAATGRCAARDQIRRKDADQHHSSPDTC